MKYELQDCIGGKLRRLSRQVDGYYRSCLKDNHITESQLTILFTLSKTGEIEQGKLAHILGLEKSTMSRNIRIMEDRHLVRRTDDYRPDVALTKSGETEVKHLIPIWEGIMDDLVQQLGQDKFEQLKNLELK